MISQPYSDVRPLIRLLRQLLMDDVPITDIHNKIASLVASGEIELVKKPYPPTDWWLAAQRQSDRLPFEWWLVRLPDGQYSIKTSDPDYHLNPAHILYRERLLPPPPVSVEPIAPTMPAPAVTVGKEPLEVRPAEPMTLRKAGIKAALDMVLEAAKWLAPQISKDSKVDDYEDDCLKKFPGLTPSTYHKRVVPAARVLRGWPAQTPPGQKPKPKPKPEPKPK